MSGKEEYFTLSMDEDKIKNLVRFYELKTEAEMLLLSKEAMVRLLNEVPLRAFSHKPRYPEPPTTVQIDKLNISFTKSVPLSTGGVPPPYPPAVATVVVAPIGEEKKTTAPEISRELPAGGASISSAASSSSTSSTSSTTSSSSSSSVAGGAGKA